MKKTQPFEPLTRRINKPANKISTYYALHVVETGSITNAKALLKGIQNAIKEGIVTEQTPDAWMIMQIQKNIVSFLNNPERKPKTLAVSDVINPPKNKREAKPKVKQDKPDTSNRRIYADWMDLKDLHVDPKRFQNRTDAFSEISAQSVANHLDWNKFDPIVVWKDPKNGKTYVLSGHSRFEGLKRRGEKEVPIRYFKGTEAEAVEFSRIHANRSATAENLVEDLKAYIFARDSGMKAGELKESFKGKWKKLEDLSALDLSGSFIRALSAENTSEFPFVERFARWTGQMRKELPGLTHNHEANIFTWLYDKDARGFKLDEPSFKELIRERATAGKDILFDCNPTKGCNEPQPYEKFVGNKKEAQQRRELARLTKEIDAVRTKLSTDEPLNKIYTDEERNVYRQIGAELIRQRDFLEQSTKKGKKETALFGVPKLPKENKNKKIITAAELANREFEVMHLDEPYRSLIGEPPSKFHAIIFGLPGQGKSTFALHFANYLADHHGRVLYISAEEGHEKALADKIKRSGHISPNLDIADVSNPDEAITLIQETHYPFVFIDSADRLGLTAKAIQTLRAPLESAFIIVHQSTKDGSIKGQQELKHDADIVINVEKMKAITLNQKNRFGAHATIPI